MKRYDMVGRNYEPGYIEMECDDGDWVRYEDAQAEIDRLRGLLERIYDECSYDTSPGYIQRIIYDETNPPNDQDQRGA